VFYRLNRRELIEQVPGKAGRRSAWRKYTGKANGATGDDDKAATGGEDSLFD